MRISDVADFFCFNNSRPISFLLHFIELRFVVFSQVFAKRSFFSVFYVKIIFSPLNSSHLRFFDFRRKDGIFVLSVVL